MPLSRVTQGAVTAERNRRRAAFTGCNFSGTLLWTEQELTKLRAIYATMTYCEMTKHMPGRTLYSIKHRCQLMGLTKKRHAWTGAEITKLRQVYTKGTTEGIRNAFPDCSMNISPRLRTTMDFQGALAIQANRHSRDRQHPRKGVRARLQHARYR